MATSTKKSTAAAKSAKPAKSMKSAAPAKSVAPKAAKAAPPAKAPPKAPVKAAAPAKPAKAPAAPGAKAPASPGAKAAAPPAKPVPASAPKAAAAPAPAAPATTPAVGKGPPPPPRLTVRTPVGADELKQKIGALATATANIRNLKRSIQKSFFDIGLILKDVDERKLYEVKGYGSFEAFLEREIDLGKQLGLRLARAVQVFQREAALAAGLDRVQAAIAVLDGEVEPTAAPPSTTPTATGVRSPIPFHKQ